MKMILPVSGALLLLALLPIRADLVLKPGDVLAICGDSITEQKIYSADIEEYLLMCQPVDGLRVAQFGWGGERASGFQARVKSDVLPFKPTVVTTCYGMNDGGYTAMSQATGDVYHDNLELAVKQLKAGGVRDIILGSPGVVDSTAYKRPGTTPDVYNQTLDALRGIAQALAQKDGLLFADLHTPMMDVMAKAKAAYGENYQFAGGDGVHPGPNGHLVMAYAFLKALGCDGAIGTITVDLGADQATGTPGQKIVSCDKGTVTVKSTRYPFCFQGDPTKPTTDNASVVNFFPFNDDLNRYLLVVKGIKGTKAKVTWGKTSKEFSADDLAKGINLAAEFIDNPFQDQFKKVSAAVGAQQADETILVKSYLHNVDQFKTMAPDADEALQKVTHVAMAHDKELFDAVQALVVPVEHTIKIEPEP
jgi:lysophospholipase L1-like esterase